MAQQTFTGRKRVRKFFGHIKEVAEMPNLIEVQKASYDQFLMVDEPVGGRLDEGLQAVFRSVFPISDFSGTSMLEFVRYEFEQPKYDVDECRQRGMTFAAPLKVTLRLIVFDIDEETGAKSVKDIKEQDVYMGDIPLMTMNGTFIVNGTERVIVSQMHRSPGVFFDHDKGKTHSSGKLLFAARVIPYRGSWLDIEFDAKDIVYARIDRRRKIPVTSLMFALGLDGEEILSTFYKKIIYKRTKEGWRVPFDANRFRGYSTINDLIDADTGKVVLEAGKKLTVRGARQMQEKGLKALRLSDEELVGNYLAEDLVNPKTGEIHAEAGEEITDKSMKALNEQGYKELPLLDIDHVNVGAYIRNTLSADKNMTREDALFDIYRVMRPGEPPTLDSAQAMFQSLFFDAERYDLSAVGRVKMNMRLDLDAPDTQRTLRKEDILSRHQDAGRSARRQGRDRRHRPSRQPPCALGRRAHGEPVPHRPAAHGARDQGAHVVGRHRHGHAAGPDQREAGGCRRARVLRLLAALAVHGPDQPAVGDHPQAPSLGAWTGRSDPRARRLRGARRASDALRPHLPDRDAGRPEHRSDQLARDLRAREQVRLRRDAVPQGQGRSRHRRGRLSLGDGRGPLSRRAGQRAARRRRAASPRTSWSAVTPAKSLPVTPDKVDYMDVSPKQLVSVAAALIPFLENDDANRALMGSNMQRQAVPLVRAEAPFVGTGMEGVVARDSGAAIAARRSGVIDQIDATRVVIRATEDLDPTKSGVDIYRLMKYQRSNQSTCINQRPLVKVGDIVKKGDIIADGPSTDLGELALGRNVLVAFMPWNGYNFEDSILLSERIVKEDVFTSIHIEEFEVMARDTKLGPEEITRDIPNVSEEALKNLDEAGIVYIGAEVRAGDILVGKITPKGESPMTPEEKLLRAIFGEKASDVRDTSLRVPPGVQGTIVEVRVFNRHGVDKDERALAIEREEIERLAKDRDDEQAILDRNVYSRLAELLEGRQGIAGPKGFKKDTKITRAVLEEYPKSQWWLFASPNDKLMAEIEAMRKQYDESKKGLEQRFLDKVEKLQRGDELPPGVMKMVKVFVAVKRKIQPGDKMAGRHGNKGVVSKIVPIEDMPFLEDGTHADIVLNPLGVPSRMNVGQILETHLGWACAGLGKRIGQTVDAYLSKQDIKPLKETLKKVYGEDETIKSLNDNELIELGRNLQPRRADRDAGVRRCQGSRHRGDAEACRSRRFGSVDRL